MIKAIETCYNGYKLRSRAEARWMILMDRLSIPYIYEGEGIELSDGTKYLPDFYLPQQDCFLEVKGLLDEDDKHKIEQLCVDTGKQIVVAKADMRFDIFTPEDEAEWCENDGCYISTGRKIAQKCGTAELCKCHNCGKVYFKDMDGAWDCEVCGYYDGDAGFTSLMDGELTIPYEPDAEQALTAAKSARFEKWDCP